MKIGFIGFGEVGYEMTKGFISQDSRQDIFVYDPLYEKTETKKRAEEAQAILFNTPLQVVQQELDVLFVAVPAPYSFDAWKSVASHITNTTICVDLTTASSETKKQIVSELHSTNSKFVDAAIMGPLKGNQHKVPMMVSGNASKEFMAWGKELEMNLEYVSEVPGDATNIKFIRSIFTKGLSTLLHEVMEIAEKLEMDETILASITSTIDKEPFENVINRLITGNVLHSERRVKEMENVIAFMLENDVEPHMTRATRDKLSSISNTDLKERFHEKAPTHWKQVMQSINHGE